MRNYIKIFYLICFLIIINNVSFADNVKNIEEFRKKYGDVNYYYGKWIVSSYEYEKRERSSYYSCDSRRYPEIKNEDMYTKIENEYIEKSFSNEIGKTITISKDFYEYPINKNNKSNFLSYIGKNQDNENVEKIEKVADEHYEFFNDGKCKMHDRLICYKIDNPTYKVITHKKAYITANFYGPDQSKFKDILFLYIYHNNDERTEFYRLVEYFVIALKEDNSVIVFKTFGDILDKIILEKIK